MTPRDGRLQQYNNSTPHMRGTRSRKIRNEEERNAHPVKCVQSTKHPEGNTTAEKGSPYYRNFPESQRRNIHDTDSDSHANAGLQNSDVICYSNSILQVIVSCTHGILSESTKQRPPTFQTLLRVCKCDSFHDHWQTRCCQSLQLCKYFQV